MEFVLQHQSIFESLLDVILEVKITYRLVLKSGEQYKMDDFRFDLTLNTTKYFTLLL